MRPRYRAIARRDGRGWVVQVHRLWGTRTQVYQLDQAEDKIRDIVSRVMDVPKDSFDVVVECASEDEAVLEGVAS